MKYNEWKIWLQQLPWYLKWFVILILIRPIVDNFYYLKNISPLLSPLYFVGIATPILCILAMAKYKINQKSVIDSLFAIWTLIMLVSLLFVFIYDPLSKTFLEYLLKLTMPSYIFFFLRLLIRSKKDLDGVLQSFIYSTFFVIAVFMYEIIVNPIKVLKTRDLERIQGSYGDVMNYAIYTSLGLLIVCYFHLKNKESSVTANRKLIIAFVLSIACLFKISHTASYGVFIVLTALFILFNLKTNFSNGILILGSIFILAYFFGSTAIEEKISPLIKTDIAVYEGKKSSERLLHGRVGRWKMMLEEYAEFPISAQLFGMPLALKESYSYIGTGSHNDFIRVLFYTGLTGLFLYITILYNVINRLKYLITHDYFLALGTLAILLMYSVSTCPTLYAPLIYIVLSVFAYLSLPSSILKTHEN